MVFNKSLKQQLEDAERIIRGYETMLNFAHLSENKSSACNYARNEILEYKRKYKGI